MLATPRFTRDADLAVALATDAEAEALIHGLRARDCGIEALALLRVASPAELGRARDSLALIAARGYHRGRDLMSEINTLLPLAP